MPLLGTRGAASARGFGFTALTGIGGPYWMGLLRRGFGDDTGYAITVTSPGDIYISGSTYDGTNDNAVVAKYNNSGTIQWQSVLSGGSSVDFRGVAVDSSGNVYAAGRDGGSTAGFNVAAKYNSSGTIQWQKTLGNMGVTQYVTPNGPNAVAIDSSSNIYVFGNNQNGNFEVIKYNSSGTVQFQNEIGYANANAATIIVDSSGNIYTTGRSGVTSPFRASIIKYNSSFAVQWQKSLLVNGSDTGGTGCAVDSSGNVYVTGTSDNGGDANIFLAKYDSSGTLQWQRRVSLSTASSVVTDSIGNVYISGYASGFSRMFLAKYNSTGTIQWQRYITTTSNFGQSNAISIAVDISNNLYVAGRIYTGSNQDIFIAKLPNDGSKTGTYTVGGISLTYAASSQTIDTQTASDSSSTYTVSATSFTSSSTSRADAAGTLTSSVTTI